MQKSERIGKRVVQVMVFFVIISIAAFAVAAPPGAQVPSTHPPQAISFPDIKAMELKFSPSSPKMGDIVSLRGSYMVIGCVKKPFFGKITLDGTTLIEQEMPNADPDCLHDMFDNYFGNVSWTATSGTHTFVFSADSKNDIFEGPVKENNNTKTITISVPFPQIDRIKDMKTKQPIPVPVPGVR